MLVACVIFQFGITFLIITNALTEEEMVVSFEEAPRLTIGITRFVAAMVMHIILNSEMFNGLKMMKYSVNHWWKFDAPFIAWFTGFLQVCAMLLISFVNLYVINISDTVIDIMKDFTALIIISEFDDIFGAGMLDEKASKVCTDPEKGDDKEYDGLFVIETTTSLDARDEKDNKMDDDPIYDMVIHQNRMKNIAAWYD